MKRNTAREIAVQLLFSKKYTDFDEQTYFSEENLASLSEECELYSEKMDAESKKYICEVLSNYSEHEQEIDSVISSNLKSWNINRISSTALAVLKCSTTEMMYMKDIPYGASINSAVEIAKNYDEPDVVSFINGVLGSISKSI